MYARLLARHTLVALAGLAIAFTALMVLGSAPAFGDQVTCGETITKDTTLDNDLIDCPGDGIVIGADRITLDLNGHTIAGRFDNRFCLYDPSTGDYDDCPHQDGIDNSAGHDWVVIENGELRNFETELRLVGANRNKLIALQVHRDVYPNQAPYNVPSTGIYVSRSERNQVLRTMVGGGDPAILLSGSDRNTISDSSIVGSIARDRGDGIRLVEGSDRNRLMHSKVDGDGGTGLLIEDSTRNVVAANDLNGRYGNLLSHADHNVIVGNVLNGGRETGLGLGESDGNVVRSNTTSICRFLGYFVDGDANVLENNATSDCPIVVLGSGNVIRANTFTGNGPSHSPDFYYDGFRVEAGSTSTLVEDNVATGAFDDGIDIEAPGTLVRGNTANYNFDYGIEAVEGVIDGGGNRAFGNGNPLQCLNIVCN
jgi:hypothetical protein